MRVPGIRTSTPTRFGPDRVRSAVAIAVALVVILSFGASLGRWSGPNSGAGSTTVASETIAEAERSLANGSGPAGGSGAACAAAAAGEDAMCTATSSPPDASSVTVPTARFGAAMAYDAADGYVVLFSGSSQHDTWTFSHGVWTELDFKSSQEPSARTGASITYDARDGYILLFGGEGTSGGGGFLQTPYYQDTWSFVHGVWTNLTARPISRTNTPAPRYIASMTYDYQDGYVVLFGGDYERTAKGDTWTFAGGVWTNITSTLSSSPPCRFGASMSDLTGLNGYVVLFGGDTKKGGTCFNEGDNLTIGDTWEFLSGRWLALNLTHGPPARWDATMSNDAAEDELVLFGGIGTSDTSLPGTWLYRSSGGWSEVGPVRSPEDRFSASAAFDVADGYVLLFGGLSEPEKEAPVLGDVWAYRSGVWYNFTPLASPPALRSMSLAYDPREGYVLLFGGISENGSMGNSTWKFSEGEWFELAPSLSPPAVYGASLAYAGNAADDSMLLFGGVEANGTLLDQTWAYSRGDWGPWTNSTLTPPARWNASMVADPTSPNASVVLFGGENRTATFGDTWIFAVGNWTEVNTTVAPSPRASAGLVFDALGIDHYVLLFGGTSGGIDLSDTWEFGPTDRWSEVHPIGPSAPSGRSSPEMSYDEYDAYVLLFGGFNGSEALNDTWSYADGYWEPIPVHVGPPARGGAGVAFDPIDNYTVLFGGALGPGAGATTLGDTWLFSNGAWSNASAAVVLPPAPVTPPAPNTTLPLIAGAIVVIVAVVVLAAVLLRRRRRAGSNPTIESELEGEPSTDPGSSDSALAAPAEGESSRF